MAVGLHVRFKGAFSTVIDKASLLSLPLFQAFFKEAGTSSYIPISDELIAHYAAVRSKFTHVIAHSAYTINLAQPHILKYRSLKKELHLAQNLQFTHMVFHPGAVLPGMTREKALDTIARNVNLLTKQMPDITCVLENSAHRKKALGGDIEELAYIQARLDRPEKVSFCIDTAHAYVFGYSIKEDGPQWIDMVCNLLTPDAIALIHVNDTLGGLGSGNDYHCIPGSGNIGENALKSIVQHPLISEKPVILELPQVSEEEELKILQKVRSWREDYAHSS